MANIRFLCPKCSLKMSIDSNDVHMHLICPDCQTRIRPWGCKLLDIKFACPTCDQKMIIDAGAAGFTVTCPNCSSSATVPHDFTTPLPEPPKSPALEPSPESQPEEAMEARAPSAEAKSKQPVATSLLTEEEIAFLAGN